MIGKGADVALPSAGEGGEGVGIVVDDEDVGFDGHGRLDLDFFFLEDHGKDLGLVRMAGRQLDVERGADA